MASNTIKGLTIEIGGDTTKLGKALEDVNKKSRSLSSELGSINRLLKMDPGNTELLAQKQKVLADAVSNTSKKLETLKEAERQVQAQFERGEASEEQVRALQREIIATSKKLENYENAAKETADALDRLGDNSDDVAKEIDDVASSADKAEKESEDLGSSLDGTLSTGFKAVAAVAAAASAAIVGCVEASHEYRTAMGKLDTAFAESKINSEAATNTYKELQSVLGETDQAVEASGHLAKLADTEEDLNTLTESLVGVYATFGQSLPVEALAESANETARTGQIAGNLADALNWAAQEGETFGVKLKDNIDFTKKTTKELDKMTDAQRKEYEATKKQHDTLEDWNKRVEEAASAEDYFNLALEECSDEQERQQLITKTLNKLYGNAAKQYKATNKQVIEANKANEEWNETMAELGEELAPVVVEVKKFGTELLASAKAPLKDAAGILTDHVLPALSRLGSWVTANTPIIKAGLVGVAAALATYKTATIAAEVAQKGLKGAVLATEAAQKALNIAQAATPWGLVAVAVAGVTTALVAYAVSMENAKSDAEVLTEEERELMAAADETAEAFREQKKAADENAGGITAQMNHIQNLAKELQTLADASGKVKEKDQARAQFILNELNEALGTEYKMTDGVVQKYADLKKNIDAVVQSKTANALLEANNALYVEAIQAENQALKDLVLSEKDYQAQLAVSKEADRVLREAQAALQQKLADAKTEADYRMLGSEAKRVESLRLEAEREKETLAEKKAAYDESATNYGNYSTTIMNYEEAQQAALEGNYNRAVEILKNKSGNYDKYADDVDQATRDAIDSLFKEAINAGIEAERTKTNFEKGVKGYTKKMVDEAEKGYKAALNKWATAKADAEAVGKDLGDGLSGGMENKRSSLLGKARSIVQSIIGAMRKEADSHSPSRKTMAFGEDMGKGTEIGMENKTADILKTARNQVQSIMYTYETEGEDFGQTTARAVTERAASRSAERFRYFAEGNGSKLDAILAAIERGQILTIDGKAWVGATADLTDNALGQRRALVARGAV